jgi:hypothetical protein
MIYRHRAFTFGGSHFFAAAKTFGGFASKRANAWMNGWSRFGRTLGICNQYKTFPEWWIKKGTKLFDSPQIEMDLVKALTAGLELLLKTDLKIQKPGMVCVAIPMHLDPKSISEAIFKLFTTARTAGRAFRPRCQVSNHQVWKSQGIQEHQACLPHQCAQCLH